MQLSGKTMARVFSVGDLGCSWKIYSSAYSWNRNIEETIKVCLRVDGYTKKKYSVVDVTEIEWINYSPTSASYYQTDIKSILLKISQKYSGEFGLIEYKFIVLIVHSKPPPLVVDSQSLAVPAMYRK